MNLRDLLQHKLAPAAILNEVVRQAGPLKANSTRILAGEIRPTEAQTMDWVVIDRHGEPEAIRDYLRDLVSKRIPEKLGYDPLKDVQVLTGPRACPRWGWGWGLGSARMRVA